MESEATFLILNFITSFLFAALFWKFLPKQLQEPRQKIFLFLFVFNFFVPALGIIAAGIAVSYLHYKALKIKKIKMKTMDMPLFIRQKIVKPLVFGEGGAWARACSTTSLLSARVQSMVAMNAVPSPQVNNLNYLMLQNDSDELRLYAFSSLNNQENSIDDQIKQTQDFLAETKNPIRVAKLQRDLVSLYWELIYYNLVQHELLDFTIERALHYANLALVKLAEDAGLWLLMGKIYMRQNEINKAFEAFKKAKKYHAPDEKTLPFLAELCFKQKRFMHVKQLLCTSDVLWKIPLFYPLMNFWCNEHDTASS